jgi:hypothetical protein
MPKKKAGPDTLSAAYVHMQPLWHKIDAVLGGTETMRGSGETYLPRHNRESQAAYDERLNRTVLVNTTEQTLSGWVGRPFGKPIQFNEDIPIVLEPVLEDADQQGSDLDVFCRNWFRNGLAKGFSHVMVDFPSLRNDGENPRTLEDDRNDKLRPYFVQVPPENVIAAHAEIVGGVETLTHLRVLEQEVVREGFEEVVVNRIRVYEPGHVVLYEERKITNRKQVEWVIIDEYDYDLSYIPLVTFYSQREGFMLSKPPLLDLVNLNIGHWQSQSDQTAVLTVARFPMLASSGALDDESEIVVGPNQWLSTREPQGKVYYVEHTGKAINSGRLDLLDLEEKMAKYGAEFLTKKPGRQTATARALDSAEAVSPLQDMTHRFIDAVNLALRYAADWVGEESGGSVDLDTDFGMSGGDAGALTALNEARAGRDISREAYLLELQRHGVLDRSFDPVKDVGLLTNEVALLGLSTEPLDEEDEDESI